MLCNNAGVGAPSANIWDTTVNDWKWVHGVNVMGVVHGIQAFVPRMIAGGEEGYVVNTSSGDGGIAPMPAASVYAASKAAVIVAHRVPRGAARVGRHRAASGHLLSVGWSAEDRDSGRPIATGQPSSPGSARAPLPR